MGHGPQAMHAQSVTLIPQDLAGRLDGVGQDLAGRVDGVGQASSARFDVVDGAVQQLAGALGENRKQGDEALRRLGRLDSALEETGRRVELSRKPGEEAVELLRSTAKVQDDYKVIFSCSACPLRTYIFGLAHVGRRGFVQALEQTITASVSG